MTDLPPASRAGRSGGRRCAARRAHPRATAEAPVDAVGIIGLTHHLGLVGGRALVRLAVGMVESLTHYAPTSIGMCSMSLNHSYCRIFLVARADGGGHSMTLPPVARCARRLEKLAAKHSSSWPRLATMHHLHSSARATSAGSPSHGR